MLQTAIIPMLAPIDEHKYTDSQLLDFLVRGENWALAKIYDRYAGLVFSIALKNLNDPRSAEEIVQQVFTKVWRYAWQYRLERGKFSAWVSAITRRQCVDEFRRRRRTQPATDLDNWDSIDSLASSDDPVQDVQDRLEQVRIRKALQHIPSQERLVIELAFWGGMTHSEIAVYCHSPLGTVKTRLRLGMKRIRLLLQGSI